MSTKNFSLSELFYSNFSSKKNLGSEISDYIAFLVNKGGPDTTDYTMLTTLLGLFSNETLRKQIPQQELSKIMASFGEAMSIQTIQGWAYHKPLGYAGDFQIIDKIYTYAESVHPHLAKWDRYFHTQTAPRAVRNRQSYFLEQMWQTANNKPGRSSILNLASGPGRDMYEALKVIGPTKVLIDCVDQDIRAIDYAKALCQNFLAHIRFIHKNVFKFSADKSYDLIWSAGLFDYFNDNIFKRTIKRLKSFLAPHGKIVIGNFSENNPSRGYMELFNWHLIHRSEEHLRNLAIDCGFSEEQICVDQEPEGVNLFLILTNP